MSRSKTSHIFSGFVNAGFGWFIGALRHKATTATSKAGKCWMLFHISIFSKLTTVTSANDFNFSSCPVICSIISSKSTHLMLFIFYTQSVEQMLWTIELTLDLGHYEMKMFVCPVITWQHYARGFNSHGCTLTLLKWVLYGPEIYLPNWGFTRGKCPVC